MTPSQRCIDLICEFEGFWPTPYNDIADNATIGYGTFLHRGPVTDADKTLRWTKEEAQARLLAEVEAKTKSLNTSLPYPLTQNQFDATVCFAYNCGVAAAHLLLDHGKERVPDEMLRWCKYRDPKTKQWTESPGLLRRREAEASLWREA